MTQKRHTDTWTDPRVEVRPSPLGGLGTFARAPTAAGEPVFRWGGILFTPAEIRADAAKPGTVAAVDDDRYLASPAPGAGGIGAGDAGACSRPTKHARHHNAPPATSQHFDMQRI